MRLRIQIGFLVVVGVLMAGVANVGATHIDPVSIRQLIKEAELIFEGVVTAVEYRMSDVATPDHVALPHTFVTFEIEQTLKGGAAHGRSITLRFQGGPDDKGNAMMVSGVPLFDVGNRDVLFVRGNGEQLCPLVGWDQGRFRVIGGLVFTDNGQEVWLTRRGELAFGPYHALEEVLTHNLAGTRLEFEGPAAQAGQTPPTGTQWLDAPSFRNVIAGLVRQWHTPAQLAVLTPVASADIRGAFYVRAPRPEAPPAVPAAAEELSPERELQHHDQVPRLDKPGR